MSTIEAKESLCPVHHIDFHKCARSGRDRICGRADSRRPKAARGDRLSGRADTGRDWRLRKCTFIASGGPRPDRKYSGSRLCHAPQCRWPSFLSPPFFVIPPTPNLLSGPIPTPGPTSSSQSPKPAPGPTSSSQSPKPAPGPTSSSQSPKPAPGPTSPTPSPTQPTPETLTCTCACGSF
jgi:hypothetical protein